MAAGACPECGGSGLVKAPGKTARPCLCIKREPPLMPGGRAWVQPQLRAVLPCVERWDEVTPGMFRGEEPNGVRWDVVVSEREAGVICRSSASRPGLAQVSVVMTYDRWLERFAGEGTPADQAPKAADVRRHIPAWGGGCWVCGPDGDLSAPCSGFPPVPA